jgi:hypothetical protein
MPEYLNQHQGSAEFFTDYQLVADVQSRLDGASIDYAIFSGSHAALLGGHRTTPDVDIWTDHTKWDELIATFPDGMISDRRHTWRPGDSYDGVLVTLGKQGEVGIMAGTIIHADGVTYPSPFTDLVKANRVHATLGGITGWFANPADTLLFKAISQRGIGQGKHDIEDIAAIVGKTRIDPYYLLLRMDECSARKRTLPLLMSMRVVGLREIDNYDKNKDAIRQQYLSHAPLGEDHP